MNSAFIVIDGPNGVGKTTIMDRTCAILEKEGRAFLRTKEPTTSELGMHIRMNQDNYGKEVLACLVAANRYEHLEKVVEPGIQAGNLVICDRYFASSLVYQLMDGLDLSFVEELNKKILVPHLTVLLTAGEEVIESRLRKRHQLTRFERDQRKEIQLFCEARLLLDNKGWNTRSFDTGKLDVSTIATSIVLEINKILNKH